jgi:hypothetical protein
MGFDREIFSLIDGEHKQAQKTCPDQKEGEKAPERFNHVF